MIIRINEQKEVMMVAQGSFCDAIEVDGQTSFRVEAVPQAGAGERLCFDPVERCFFTKSCEQVDAKVVQARVEKRRAAMEACRRQEEIREWLRAHDWMVNKRLLGEWAEDDARWLSYLEERRIKRAEYDQALAVIANTNSSLGL